MTSPRVHSPCKGRSEEINHTFQYRRVLEGCLGDGISKFIRSSKYLTQQTVQEKPTPQRSRWHPIGSFTSASRTRALDASSPAIRVRIAPWWWIGPTPDGEGASLRCDVLRN